MSLNSGHFQIRGKPEFIGLCVGLVPTTALVWSDVAALQSFPEANFLDEFLMKSSGLLNTFAPIFSEAAAKLVPFG